LTAPARATVWSFRWRRRQMLALLLMIAACGLWLCYSLLHTSPRPQADQVHASGELIDINTASAASLQRLPGIGQTISDAIITYRRGHGPFRSIDALLAVPGIGPSTLERMRPFLTSARESDSAPAQPTQ
jgi:competence ComEA-like helix-hairpin-helix protein